MEDQEPERNDSASVATKVTRIDPMKPKSGKFSEFLTSPIVQVKVGSPKTGNPKTYPIHTSLLVAESEQCYNCLTGNFREALDRTVDKPDEDPELFGCFVEYLYRNESILTRDILTTSEYVTLARLYTLADRLAAPKSKSGILWRFTSGIGHDSSTMTLEEICYLLEISSSDIYEGPVEDPMTAHILWHASSRMQSLRKSNHFRKLITDMPNIAVKLCLSVGRAQPGKPEKPFNLNQNRFQPESIYDLTPAKGTQTWDGGQSEEDPAPCDEWGFELGAKKKKKAK